MTVVPRCRMLRSAVVTTSTSGSNSWFARKWMSSRLCCARGIQWQVRRSLNVVNCTEPSVMTKLRAGSEPPTWKQLEEDIGNHCKVKWMGAKPRSKSTAIPRKFDREEIPQKPMEISGLVESSEIILEEKPFTNPMMEDKAIGPPSAAHGNPQLKSFTICIDSPDILLLPKQENGEVVEEENAEVDCSPLKASQLSVAERPLLFFKTHDTTRKRGKKTSAIHCRSKGVQVKLGPATLPAPSSTRVQVSTTVASKSDRNAEPYVPELIDQNLEDSDQKFKRSCLENTRILNSKDSMHFLGVINDFKFLIQFLEKRIKLPTEDCLSRNDVVTLILRKIRLNHSFLSLSYEYGIDEPTVKAVFRNHIKSISKALSQLIQWFSPETIIAHIRLTFWARHIDTYVIMHCFEIQIQDPRDPFDQKQGSKLKYLFGISPDETIMYVSKGFLGSYSDVDIAIKSGFLNYVANKTVLVHVGFKNLETHLAKVNANLVRAPAFDEGEPVNLNNGAKNSPVQGCIDRLREFAFLVSPHATDTDNWLQNFCDDAIRIACALANTHNPLVKKLKFS
ncbi:hypothetical protein B566_EDAN004382 [Ephemera danica]|nr:hypothetical protein B566_EDAN004382 [Ephemera danica]